MGLLLEGRRPRSESERLPGGDGGNEGISSERGEIVEEGAEAVDRKAVVGPTGGLLGNGGRGALDFSNDAGAQRFGDLLVSVVVEHGRQALAHVPFQVVGEHADKRVGTHAIGQPVIDRSDLRSPFAPTRHDLPLPKPFRGPILPSKPPGIWRMSVQRARGARHK